MNPASREKEIFQQALDLPSAEARLGFVKGACGGDAGLLARLETLLRAHEVTSNFLPATPAAVAVLNLALDSVTEKPGTNIGRYKLLEKIGEGGFGTVYMAEQSEPVRRRVALKIIKLGMDTKEVVARFEVERQALAMMDHPNIAKVLDGGATDTGRPYFVMELVKGVPITKYCDEAKLSAKARLELFIPVCHAIQHAHQKGIIHRDIKPSNVLVTINDGVAVPKVIDFGIAKATHGRLTDSTLFTAFEQFIGTPAYMSPEQAAMTSLDIDTRSDIYSLGVLLYELLTGGPPFDARQLAQAGLDEMRRQIREVEPPRPSTRVSTMSGADQTTTANLRQLEAPKLVNLLRGDLDWIVMRCLEKNRSRRYETATGLALDLQHHLRDEPVIARPPSAAYRMQKLVLRNKLAVAATAVIASALVIGLVVSTWAYFNEKNARQYAVEAAMIAKRASDANATIRLNANNYRRRAEEESKKAGYVTAVLKELARSAPAGAPPAGDGQRMRETLDPIAGRLDKDSQATAQTKQELCEMMGDLYMASGEFSRAEAMFRQTVKLRRELLGDGHPDTAAAVNKLVEALKRQGKSAEVTSTLNRAEIQRGEFFNSARWSKMLKEEARDLAARGRFAEAEAGLHKAMAIARNILGKSYSPSADLVHLARVRFAAGDLAGASQLAEQSITVERDNRWWGTAGLFGGMRPDGYAIPYGAHTILGLVALRGGDNSKAGAKLLGAAKGVTAETRFGPQEIELAAALVAAGEKARVVEFLDAVRPRYADSLGARNLYNAIVTIGSRNTYRSNLMQNSYQGAATGREHALELDGWRMEVVAGKIPADWQRMLDEAKPVEPFPTTVLPPLEAPLVGAALAPPLALRPTMPLFLLLLGWVTAAIAPRCGGGIQRLPSRATAWLTAFCIARAVDCALFMGMLVGDGFAPDMIIRVLGGIVSWICLWEFLRALAPGKISRRDNRSAYLLFGTAMVLVVAMQLIAYASIPITGTMDAFGAVLSVVLMGLLMLTFLINGVIGLASGVYLWVWQRNAALASAQRLCLAVAAPLLALHGLAYIFLPAIHDIPARRTAFAILWATVLLPWMLAAGFARLDRQPKVESGEKRF